MDEFLISLQAKLNEAASKGEINKDIEKLQKDIEALKVKAVLDPDAKKTITDEIKKALRDDITISDLKVDTSSASKVGEKLGSEISKGVSKGLSGNNDILDNFRKSLSNIGMSSSTIDAVIKRIKSLGVTIQSLNQSASTKKKQDILSVDVAGVDKFGQAIKLTEEYDRATGDLIKSIDLVSTSQKNAGSAAGKSLAAQKTAIASLTNQINQLNRSASDKNSQRPIKDESHIQSLSTAYNEIISEIEKMSAVHGDAFSDQQNHVKKLISDYKSMVSEFKNAENVATKMKGTNFTAGLEIAKNNLDKFKANAAEFPQLTQTIKNLDSALAKTGDAAALNNFNDSLRVARAELDKVKSETTALNKSETLGIKVSGLQDSISNVERISPEIRNFQTEINGSRVSVSTLRGELAKVGTSNELSVVSTKWRAFTKAASAAGIAVTEIGTRADTTAKKVANITNAFGTGAYDTKVSNLRAGLQKMGLPDEEVASRMQQVNSALENLKTSYTEYANAKINADKADVQVDNTSTIEKLIKSEDDFNQALKASSNQATVLRNNLEGIYNTKKQYRLSLDIQKWLANNSRATQVARESLEKYYNELNESRVSVDRLDYIEKSFKKIDSEQRGMGKLGRNLKDQLSQAATTFSQWFSVSSLVMASVYKLKEAVTELKEVNTYLTEISKANENLTESDLASIGSEAFDISSRYGKKAGDYLAAVRETSRAGYENADGIAELSVAAQGAGDMTQDLANQMIIATDKAYKMGGSVEELRNVLDGMNYVTNHNAVNMTELSEGMSIVGSTAASFGVGVNQLAAALGTMISTTQQSGSEVARAFRTILLNIRQVSDEEEGIDAEGLTKYEKACNALGVSLKETRNGVLSLRNPMDVLKELAEEYNKLDTGDLKRTNLLSSVGGKLRSVQLDALLRQWPMYEKMLNEFDNGTGSMAVEAEKTAKSWEGSLNRLSNTFTDTLGNIVNSKGAIAIINFFEKILSLLDSLTKAAGSLGSVGIGVGALLAGFNKGGLFKTIQKNQYIAPEFGLRNDKSFNDMKKAASDWWGNYISNVREGSGIFKSAKKAGGIFSSKGLLSSIFRNPKEKIDVDALFPEQTDEQFSSLLTKLQEQQKAVDAGRSTWNDYYSTLKEGEKWQIDFVNTNNLQTAGVQNLRTAYRNAREDVEQYNRSLEKSTVKGKAAAVGQKALSFAFNMAATWAFAKALEWAAEEFYNFFNKAKIAKETADAFSTSFKELQKEQATNTDTVKNLNDEYKTLSSGVDAAGNNMSLTADEYERYHEITNQIADLMPSLVSGFDAQGNAILKAKGNLADLNAEYAKQKQHEAIQAYNEKDDHGNRKIESVFKDYENESLGGKKFYDPTEYNEIGSGNYYHRDYTTAYSREEMVKYLRALAGPSGKNASLPMGYYDLLEMAGIDPDQDFTKIQQQASDYASQLDDEIKTGNQKVSQVALNYLQTKGEYWDLVENDENKATQVAALISGLTESMINANGLTTQKAIEDFVSSVLNGISENKDGVANAIADLFTFDPSKTDLNPIKVKEKINSLIQLIASALGIENADGLKFALNFDVDTTADNYQKSLDLANSKFAKDALGKRNIKAEERIQQFYSTSGINTDEEITSANKAIQNSSSFDEMVRLYGEYMNQIVVETHKTFSEAWSDLDNPDSDSLKNLKKELTELAEKGDLTKKTFNATSGSETFLDQIGISAQDAVDKIYEVIDSSKQLNNLKSDISMIREAYSTKRDNGVVGADSLSQMSDKFGDLSYWGKYEQIVGSSTSSLEECRKAQNRLATEYINSKNFLSGLTAENKQYYISQLNDLGVKNAAQVVNAQLANSISNAELAYAALTSQEQANVQSADALKNKTAEEILSLQLVRGASDQARAALAMLAFQNTNWTDLDASGTYNQLISIANAAGVAYQKIASLQALNLINAGGGESGNRMAQLNGYDNYEEWVRATQGNPDNAKKDVRKAINKQLKKLKKQISVDIAPLPVTSTSGSGGTGSKAAKQKAEKQKPQKQEIDWIERRIDRLNTKISLLNAKKDNLFKVKGKNKNLNSQIKETTKLIKTYNKADDKYTKKANNVKLSDSLKKRVRNGDITGSYQSLIKKYGEKTANKIQKYQDYYDKAQNAKQSKAEAKTQRRALKQEKLQNYVDKYDKKAEYNALLAEDVTLSHEKRNEYLDNEKSNLERSYNYQIKIAKLNKDVTEQKRLQEEYDQKALEIDKQKLQNYVDYYDKQADYNALLADDTSLSYQARNSYLDSEKSNLKQSYDYQIEIAKLNKDTTEQKRLQAEYSQKALEIAKQEFDNISSEYNKMIQDIGYEMSYYDNLVSQSEAAGRTVSRSYYQSQKNINQQSKNTYVSEQTALEAKLPSITKGTDEYYDALDAIQQCRDAISECIIKEYELNNAINELHFDAFEKMSENIERAISEQEFLLSLFEHEKTASDETGTFTEAGYARLGLYSTSYNEAKTQADNDAREVAALREMAEKGILKNDALGLQFNSIEDLKDKLQEMYDTWQDDIKETYSIESDIVDAMKEKYQAELDLVQSLIDKKKESLQAEKDLHDYQQTITEKTSSIEETRMRIAAYSGDTSQEASAQVQRLLSELSDKEEDLRETEYERYISDQETMLDMLSEEYEQIITKRMDDFDALLQEGLLAAQQGNTALSGINVAVDASNSTLRGIEGMLNNSNSFLAELVQKFHYIAEGISTNNSTTTSAPANPTPTPTPPAPKTSTSTSTPSTSTSKPSTSTNPPGSNVGSGIKPNETLYVPDTPAQKKNRFTKQQKKQVERIFNDKKYYTQVGKNDKKKDMSKLNQYLWENTNPHKKITSAGYNELTKVLKVGGWGNLFDALKQMSDELGNIDHVAGFKSGGIARLVKSKGEDGIALVRNGEGFIPPEYVGTFERLVKVAPILSQAVSNIGLRNTPNLQNTPNTFGDVHLQFDLPHVTDADSFIDAMNNNESVRKVMRSYTVDLLAGNGRLSGRSVMRSR